MSKSSNSNFSGSSRSTTLSKGIVRSLCFTPTTQNPSPLLESPDEILKRTLSVRSVAPIASSFEIRVIGLGSCGTVFEIGDTELAYKKGLNTTAMWQDFSLTNTVHNAVMRTHLMLRDAFGSGTVPRTPRCHEFVLPDQKEWWIENLKRFPQDYRKEGALFTVDRILSLPQKVREALIKKYFDDDEEIQDEARNDEENRHCLVRVYLGQNESIKQQTSAYETLRNFPMHLNMIEDLDLGTTELAAEMAIGLAILHWEAQVDGMDTEFVLGSAATMESKQGEAYEGGTVPLSVKYLDFERRSIHLWMLDFDKASRIELTSKDIDRKLVPAYLGNDPYFPRPDIDQELWNEFSSTYVKASKLILQHRKVADSVMNLPQEFLDKIMMKIKENECWDPEKDIIFAD